MSEKKNYDKLFEEYTPVVYLRSLQQHVICSGSIQTCSTTSAMKLSGTSSLHKWSMNSKTCNGDAQFNVKDGGALTSLNALTFTLPVLTLKSGEKKLDKNAYKALKTETYKTIPLQADICNRQYRKGQQVPGKDKGQPEYSKV